MRQLEKAAAEAADLPKKREILEGARRVFRAEGFDGASMGQIAQAAGVSKGTLYVYFPSKEALFQELVLLDRAKAAEQLFVFDEDDTDVRRLLQRAGESFVSTMIEPDHIALIRMVMGASEKFPDAGRLFYETGPRRGSARLAVLLRKQVEAGRLVIDEDLELAAVHFLSLCQGQLVKPLLFGCPVQPTAKDIERTVASAVTIFLRAFGPKPA